MSHLARVQILPYRNTVLFCNLQNYRVVQIGVQLQTTKQQYTQVTKINSKNKLCVLVCFVFFLFAFYTFSTVLTQHKYIYW